jgi:anti-anti-sigma factor
VALSESPPFGGAVREEGGLLVVSLRGELDVSTLAEVSATLAAAIARGEDALVLDLSAVKSLDSAIAGAIVRACEFLRARSRSLVLRLPSRQAELVLDAYVGDAQHAPATSHRDQHRTATEAHALDEQLNRSLNTSIVIEQAKGMLAERQGLDMEQAFATLRNHARNHHVRLADVANDIIDGALLVPDLYPRPPPTRS